jgi:hypothetical protein
MSCSSALTTAFAFSGGTLIAISASYNDIAKSTGKFLSIADVRAVCPRPGVTRRLQGIKSRAMAQASFSSGFSRGRSSLGQSRIAIRASMSVRRAAHQRHFDRDRGD